MTLAAGFAGSWVRVETPARSPWLHFTSIQALASFAHQTATGLRPEEGRVQDPIYIRENGDWQSLIDFPGPGLGLEDGEPNEVWGLPSAWLVGLGSREKAAGDLVMGREGKKQQGFVPCHHHRLCGIRFLTWSAWERPMSQLGLHSRLTGHCFAAFLPLERPPV